MNNVNKIIYDGWYDFNSLEGFEIDPMCFLYALRRNGANYQKQIEYSTVRVTKRFFSWEEEAEEKSHIPYVYSEELPDYFELKTEIDPKRIAGPSQIRNMRVTLKVSDESSQNFYNKMRKKVRSAFRYH